MPDYGSAHQKLRKQLLPNAYGTPCPRCGRLMSQGQELQLDHGDPGATGYLGIVHGICNRRAGGQLGRARLRAKIRADRERWKVSFDRCAIGIEISEDRLHTSIGMARTKADSGVITVELLAYLSGTASAVGEALRYVQDLSPVAVVIDPHSPASTLLRPLEDLKVKHLVRPSTTDLVVAHGDFLDRLVAGAMRHVEHPRLTEAARAAEQRRAGGAQTWDRRNRVDVSPITAVTLATWGLLQAPAPQPPLVVL